MPQKAHPQRFPNESRLYRSARNKLLSAETDLRRQVERVARMRRKLPLAACGRNGRFGKCGDRLEFSRTQVQQTARPVIAKFRACHHFCQAPDFRRRLLGGQVPEDYIFDAGRPAKLSELFQDKLDTLLIYNYMFAPQAKQATELQFMPPDKGQNQRHIDMLWPLWNLLDLTPEGRGAGWFPSLTY